MSQSLVVNGVTYPFPDVGESDWGQNVTDWAIAVTQNMLQRSGGAFTLGAEVDFGASFGLKSLYYKGRSSNIASAGVMRLANTDAISWRNAGNSADLALAVDGSNQLTFNGSALAVGGSILSGNAGRLSLYPATGVTVDDVYIQNSQNISVQIAAQATRSTGLTYTLPNPGDAVSAANIVLSEGAQTLNGAMSLSALLALTATSNQLRFGTTNTTTISATAPSSSRVYTMPDVGGNADFVMNVGNQSIAGTKTLTGILLIPNGSVGAPSIGLSGTPSSGIYSGGSGAIAIAANGSNVAVLNTGSGCALLGSSDGSSAGSGFIGERITSAASGVSLTDSQYVDVASITLTAGEWDVYGILQSTSAAAGQTNVRIGISTTAGNSATGLTQGDTELRCVGLTTVGVTTIALALPCVRMLLTSTTTVYLKGYSQLTSGSTNSTGNGRITARRIR